MILTFAIHETVTFHLKNGMDNSVRLEIDPRIYCCIVPTERLTMAEETRKEARP